MRRLFEVNSEPHAGARPSVRLCVGLIRNKNSSAVFLLSVLLSSFFLIANTVTIKRGYYLLLSKKDPESPSSWLLTAARIADHDVGKSPPEYSEEPPEPKR